MQKPLEQKYLKIRIKTNKQKQFIDTENKMVVARARDRGLVGKTGEGNQKIQTCIFKIRHVDIM